MSALKVLTPLGFLGLLGLLVIILIYILKPNYQQKLISSSYVWKLSLKYRKKRINTNKLRQLLILICQLLFITSCALILTQPYLEAAGKGLEKDTIFLIDASASMLARDVEGSMDGGKVNSEETRFERAITLAKQQASQVISNKGTVSIILMGGQAEVIVTYATSIDDINGYFDGLECGYGEADVQKAMNYVEDLVIANPNTDVKFFTATEYADTGNIEMIYVSRGEWNAAILDCRVILTESNYYEFEVDVASYNWDMKLPVFIKVSGANVDDTYPNGQTISADIEIDCLQNGVATIRFFAEGSLTRIYSYESAYIEIKQSDSLAIDNSMYIYGGTKEDIKILYVGNLNNTFVQSALTVLQTSLKDKWNIIINEFELNEEANIGYDSVELKGYDFYIFEHRMPPRLPTDGVIFFLDPNFAPPNTMLSFSGTIKNSVGYPLSFGEGGKLGEASKILESLNPSKVFVTQYTRVFSYEGYEPLLYANDDPILLVRNDEQLRIAVLTFSVHYSNIAVRKEWFALWNNIFQYFLPSTINKHMYDVNETVSYNARGRSLSISGAALSGPVEFPGEVSLKYPGTYTFSQELLSNLTAVEFFYVRIPRSQSEFLRVDTFQYPVFPSTKAEDLELLLYLAIMLTACLFIERALRTADEF